MRTPTMTRAEEEIIRFLTNRPSPEQIIAFHPSPEVSERAYELIRIERERELTDGEQEEMDLYLYLNHFMQMLKIEAHRRLQVHSA